MSTPHDSAFLRATLTRSGDTATDSLLWESVLTSTESIITYRRRYQSQAQVETMLDLLLLDRDNPRSLAFQLDRLAEDLAELPRPTSGSRLSTAQRELVELSAAVQVADTAAMATVTTDADGVAVRAGLEKFLDHAMGGLQRIADAIDAEHFSHQLPQLAVFQGTGPGGGPAAIAAGLR